MIQKDVSAVRTYFGGSVTCSPGGAGFLALGSLASSLQTAVDNNEGFPSSPTFRLCSLAWRHRT